MNPREDNVWIPDDTYYCKLIGRLVDNILCYSPSVFRYICHFRDEISTYLLINHDSNNAPRISGVKSVTANPKLG